VAGKKRAVIRGGAYTPKTGIFARQSFPSRRQYENALARRRGFANVSQQRAASVPRASKTSLSAVAQQTERRVAAALRAAREQKISFTRAAELHKTTTAAMRRYAGANVERQGRRLVLKSQITFFAADPPRLAHDFVASESQCSAIGTYMSYVGQYLNTGSAHSKTSIKAFEGVRIDGVSGQYRLLTDLDALRRLPLSDIETTEGIYLDIAG